MKKIVLVLGLAVLCFGVSSCTRVLDDSAIVMGPPLTPTGLTLHATDDSLLLTWTANTESDVKGYIVYWALKDSPYLLATDVGNTTSYEPSGLTNNISYKFTVQAYDKEGYGSGFHADVIGTPKDIIAPSNVTAFKLFASTSNIQLTWKNPKNKDLQGVKVVRLENGEPSGFSDGTQVYNGLAESFQDNTATPGMVYYYKIFAFDEIPNYSTGSYSLAGICGVSTVNATVLP